MPNIILVNPSSIIKKPILEKLISDGYKLIIVHDKTQGWFSEFSDKIVKCDYSDVVKSAEIILSQLSGPIDGVVTFTDAGCLLVSALVDSGKLVGTSLKTMQLIKDKVSFRSVCELHGIMVPRSMKISQGSNLREINEKIFVKLPWIIKPISGLGSKAVRKISNIRDLNDYLSNINWHEYKEFILEEYIPGNEVDIDILVQNGEIKYMSLYDNYTWGDPYFMQVAGNIPSNLSKSIQRKLKKLAKNIVKIFKIKNACLHFEAMASDRGVYPIELNVRMGGAETYTFNKGVFGVDLIEASVKIATNQKLPVFDMNNPKCSMRAEAFMPIKTGVLKTKKISNKILQLPYVDLFYFRYKIGSDVLAPPDGFRVLGWFTVKAKSDIDAKKYVSEVLEMVKYEIE